MYNDILTIGRFTIHGYGLMIGIGVVCAILVAQVRAKRKGLSADALYSIALLALIFGFVGAKLLFCLVELKAIIADPMLILSGNGFILYGGIIGGIIAVMIYCRIKKISFLRYFDLAAPSIALAQGFGRIGCFLAGCCYGRETGSSFCVVFTSSQYAPNGVKLIPTQLISSAGDFLIALILLLYASRDRKIGKTGGLYLILYSFGRSAVEFLRADYRGSVGPLSTSQFISIFILILGVLLFFLGRIRPRAEENDRRPERSDRRRRGGRGLRRRIRIGGRGPPARWRGTRRHTDTPDNGDEDEMDGGKDKE
jgi:phosphatidylglycerol:prolipoprotein diacylglycerol transferase